MRPTVMQMCHGNSRCTLKIVVNQANVMPMEDVRTHTRDEDQCMQLGSFWASTLSYDK